MTLSTMKAAMASQDDCNEVIEFSFEEFESKLQATDATVKKLRSISANLRNCGAVNQQLALECFDSFTNFGNGKLHLRQYTSSLTKTNYKATMEALSMENRHVIGAVAAAIVALSGVFIAWLIGKLSGSGGGGGSPGGGSPSPSPSGSTPPTEKDAEEAARNADTSINNYQKTFRNISEQWQYYRGTILPTLENHLNALADISLKDAKNIIIDIAEQKVKEKSKPKYTQEALDKVKQDFQSAEAAARDCYKEMVTDAMRNDEILTVIRHHTSEETLLVYTTNEAYMSAMSNSVGTLTALLEGVKKAQTLAANLRNEYLSLNLDTDDKKVWKVSEGLMKEITDFKSMNGSYTVPFNGKTYNPRELINAIEELKNAPAKKLVEPSTEIIKSIEKYLTTTDFKAILDANNDLIQVVGKLSKETVGTVHEMKKPTEVDVESISSDDKLAPDQQHRVFVDDVIKSIAHYTAAMYQVSHKIIDFVTRYANFARSVCTALAELMIGPNFFKNYDLFVRSCRNVVNRSRTEFDISVETLRSRIPDYEDYYGPNFSKEIKEIEATATLFRKHISNMRFEPKSSEAAAADSEKVKEILDKFKAAMGK